MSAGTATCPRASKMRWVPQGASSRPGPASSALAIRIGRSSGHQGTGDATEPLRGGTRLTKSCSPTSPPAVTSTNCAASLRPGPLPTDALIEHAAKATAPIDGDPGRGFMAPLHWRWNGPRPACFESNTVWGRLRARIGIVLTFFGNRPIFYKFCTERAPPSTTEHHRGAPMSFERIPCFAAEIPCSPRNMEFRNSRLTY